MIGSICLLAAALAAATSVAVAPTLVARFQVSSLQRLIHILPLLQNVVTCFEIWFGRH